MAIDVGSRRIGVAVSDEHHRMALPLETVDAKPRQEAAKRVADLVDDYSAGELVVGWPLDMRGQEGRAVERVNRLAGALEAEFERRDREIELVRWDERMTTSAADRLLIDADVSRERRKETIDQVAACKILEGYLGYRSNSGELD